MGCCDLSAQSRAMRVATMNSLRLISAIAATIPARAYIAPRSRIASTRVVHAAREPRGTTAATRVFPKRDALENSRAFDWSKNERKPGACRVSPASRGDAGHTRDASGPRVLLGAVRGAPRRRRGRGDAVRLRGRRLRRRDALLLLRERRRRQRAAPCGDRGFSFRRFGRASDTVRVEYGDRGVYRRTS